MLKEKIITEKYGAEEHQIMAIYKSELKDTRATIIYFHGGGLTTGSYYGDKDLFLNYNKNGIDVVSVNYKMYPNARYPEFVSDCALAVKWVFENYKNMGLNKNMFIQGQSAGAYISMLLCFNEHFFKSLNFDDSVISGYIFDAGQPTVHFRVLEERGEDSRAVRIDDAAPIFHLKDKLYRPILLISYTQDVICRLAQNTVVAETFKNYEIKSPFYFYVLEGSHCSGSAHQEKGVFGIEKYVYEFVSKHCSNS